MPTENSLPAWCRAPVRILKIPLAFFGLPSSDADDHARVESLISELKEELRAVVTQAPRPGEAEVPDHLLEALRVMPITLYRVGDEFDLPRACAPILDEHAYLMYYAFLSDPSAQARLEECLLGYPEYVYHLLELNVRRQEKGLEPIPLAQSVPFYERKLLEGGGPAWAIEWLRLNGSESYLEQILYAIHRQKELDAGCAHCYHWLRTRNRDAAEQMEELNKILPIIATNPWYAIITALNHPQIDMESLMETARGSPLWAYNWLRLVPDSPRDALLEMLLESTPWSVQYVADVNPPDAPELLERLRQRNRNPRWIPWLRRFAAKRTPQAD